jgi:hypothetical protein
MALRLDSAYLNGMPAGYRGETYEQQRAQEMRLGAVARPYDQAIQRARGDAAQQANAAGQRTGNVFLTRRTAATAADRAAAPLLAQRASAQAGAIQREMDYERARREAEQNRARQMLGGLIGGAGSILGTVMPALAPAAGAAQTVGGMVAGQPAAMTSGALMAPPQPAGMRADVVRPTATFAQADAAANGMPAPYSPSVADTRSAPLTLGRRPMRLEDTLAEVDRLPFMRMVY